MIQRTRKIQKSLLNLKKSDNATVENEISNDMRQLKNNAPEVVSSVLNPNLDGSDIIFDVPDAVLDVIFDVPDGVLDGVEVPDDVLDDLCMV